MRKLLFLLVPLSSLLCQASASFASTCGGETATEPPTSSCERIALRIDSAMCASGKGVWYTAYVNSDSSCGWPASRVLYVDLLSPDGTLLQHQKHLIADGVCQGCFLLSDQISFPGQTVNLLYGSGQYQLRAYSKASLHESGEGCAPTGLMLDGWVVDRENHPLEGRSITAVIGDENEGKSSKKVVKSDSQGYWCIAMDDFFGPCPVSLSLDGVSAKRNHGRRIIVRQDAFPNLSSQLAALEAARTGGGDSQAGYVRYIDVMSEEQTRLALGLKSVSVADLLTEKGLDAVVASSEMAYAPNQPISQRYYTEEDYGNPAASPSRLDRTDAIRFHSPSPSFVVEGTYVNGYPARWNIQVPKDFPAKVYDRNITYTWATDIKYVKSVLIIDYEPAHHPYVEVWVALRNADEIGKNDLCCRDIQFAGYTKLVAESAYIQGDKDYRRTLYWNPEVRTDSTGSATVSFYNNGYSRSLTVSAEGLTQDGVPILNE